MHVTLELHGTVREAVGEKRLAREPGAGATVGDLLAGVSEEFPAFGPLVFDSEGSIRPHVAVTRNGESVALGEGPATPLADGDTIAVAPGVAGG